jgi:ATP-dependent helicase/nuclease subunit B
MSITQLYHRLFEQLDANKSITILTPNRRLAATLHKLYHNYQLERGLQTWNTPDILPLSNWISRLWVEHHQQNLTESPLLLSPEQEAYLWEGLVSASDAGQQLLQISETAAMARSAWGLLKQWDVDLHHPLFASSEDTQALQSWCLAFNALINKHHWLDSASLPDKLIEKIKCGDITPHRQLLLLGFTELAPQIQRLTHFFPALDIAIAKTSATHYQRICLHDSEQEIIYMARWAKATLEAHPEAKIACVISALDTIRDRVYHIFSEVMDAKLFNLSAGKPLVNYPIISTALALLNLHKKQISLDVFSQLLVSPFLGYAEQEYIKRANMDKQLRRENISHIQLPLDKLDEYCPKLAACLNKFISKIDSLPSKLPYSQWAFHINELLTLLGWPGERSINSEEYQVVEQWLQVLEKLGTLDWVAEPVSLQTALHTLHAFVTASPFQAKSPQTPIQVLGVLEAAGLPFDHIWIAGMNDISWPPQPKPNPLIPKRLQRELQMPHASAERELFYCQQLLQQFGHNANHIIFSYALHDEEMELNESPLIRHIKQILPEELLLSNYQSRTNIIHAAKKLEIITDDQAPAYVKKQQDLGGVGVIKDQALCPFKAFATWRLHARELEDTLPGLRAKDRGKILHKALELLWGELHDHATLTTITSTALSTTITTNIDKAINDYALKHPQKKKYFNLEKQRLFKLLSDWLQLEKERPAFKVIANEVATEATLGQLNLKVRIDRIDELEDGKRLIIDYKTGSNNKIDQWLSDRPEEPQLPLYALIDPVNTTGITFAQLAYGEQGFKGLSHYSLDLKGIINTQECKKAEQRTWNEQMSQWQHTLNQLSDDYTTGIAKVDPKDPSETCEWCTLKPLCRIKQDNSYYD